MKKVFIGFLIVGILFAAFVYFKSRGSVEEYAGSDMQQMPSFSFWDLNGNAVSSVDLIGTPLVVNSWAAWCPFCKKELPDFAQVQDDFEDDVIFVAINRGESLEVAQTYSDELGVAGRMMMLLDPDDSFYKSIGGFSMPETLFVNRDGFIVSHRRGPMDVQEITERVENLITN
ncbi:MAG: hypothetical protein CMI52_00530 [Parcubacteria group bacterium]|nr:hypothetical protein [Parcubacteria group bacterium]|tara:strand:- start:1638 stop:2156 length:519 start_codon:yes stop_codon:yes gene_type:complete